MRALWYAIMNEDGLIDSYECDNCKSKVKSKTDVCPNCGADMEDSHYGKFSMRRFREIHNIAEKTTRTNNDVD